MRSAARPRRVAGSLDTLAVMNPRPQDRAGLFDDASAIVERRTLLTDGHVRPLQDFVVNLRRSIPKDRFVPDFDPWDGGTSAVCLQLLEAPGKWAKASGFASRNNNSRTSMNLFEACHRAGLDRRKTIMWNLVPWYIGTVTKVRAANTDDIAEGIQHLRDLILLLPRLKVVMLLGGKARKARAPLSSQLPHLCFVESLHPSDMALNQRPENRELFVTSCRHVAELIRDL